MADDGQTASIAVVKARTPVSTSPMVGATLAATARSIQTLHDASTTPDATTAGVGAAPETQCVIGYQMPDSVAKQSIANRVSSSVSGIFFSPDELLRWKARIALGPFVKDNDFTAGSPGDWARISSNARTMLSSGEATLDASSEALAFGRAGSVARDAAFYQLVVEDAQISSAVRKYLLTQTSNPALNFSNTLCIKERSGWMPDGYVYQASWLLRYIVTYDYMRAHLSADDRSTIEAFIRRNAYLMAAISDTGLADVFPRRMLGDYSTRAWNAAPRNDGEKWFAKRYDTDGNCTVDGADLSDALPVYAYVRADGTLGPRLSVLSQFYNNRRSVATLAYGAAGLLLGDDALTGSAKRYFMEWLAYSVYPDGSQGEYARNGNYCIPGQGTIYGESNLQGAAHFAALLARQGDRGLLNFSTADGLFGTESTGTQPPKSIELAIATQLNLLTGKTHWFFHEPWRSAQNLTPGNALVTMEVHYMASASPWDDFHELGLLPVADLFPKLPIAAVVMRDPQVISWRFPGATGNPVASGYGGMTDVFNVLPSAFLLRP